MSKTQPVFPLLLSAAMARNITVILGAHDVHEPETTQQIRGVLRYHMHPEYNPRTVSNDILLLQVLQQAVGRRGERDCGVSGVWAEHILPISSSCKPSAVPAQDCWRQAGMGGRWGGQGLEPHDLFIAAHQRLQCLNVLLDLP